VLSQALSAVVIILMLVALLMYLIKNQDCRPKKELPAAAVEIRREMVVFRGKNCFAVKHNISYCVS
jgi:hypothetical protein